MQITNGRRIADSTNERVQIGLKIFEQVVAPEFLHFLADGLKNGRNGSVRLQVWITKGELLSYSNVTEFKGDLDVCLPK